MKTKKTWVLLLILIVSIAAILSGGLYYLSSVRQALWHQSVKEVLEVTAQGRHSLDTFIEKDNEMLRWIAAELSEEHSEDAQAIREKMELFGTMESSVVCINLEDGRAYAGKRAEETVLEREQLEPFLKLRGQGVREPYLDARTGVRTLGVYECFTFADGVPAVVQKTQDSADIAQRFSLSFYDNTGFSYVVNEAGDILIRSQHRNSNRTFQNLFDIIDLQGNDMRTLESFKASLQERKSGVARFQYQDEEYVFCYVPMNRASDWYVVSIIPNRVIMEQEETIIYNSQLFLILIIFSVCILAVFIILYRNYADRIMSAEEKARKAAESANLAKSRFLSNMSHDIRTPMNAITGMAKLASDHADEPEKVREYMKNIRQSGGLLVSLINDILDLSKIESGKMALINEDASLEQVLSNLLHIVQPSVAQKKQFFDIRLHGVVHETLCFDSLRLSQVLINLLSNAVKFTPAEGSVSMDVTESPSPREHCAHLTFQVADTGIGIKPEFIGHVFDSFVREQEGRINQIEGSGLGMAISKMLVDMMGGVIQVESTPGEGTVFTVDLDLLLPEQAEGADVLPPCVPSVRVLYADDDPITRRTIEDVLGSMGAVCDAVALGQSTAELLSAHGGHYDLILLDWKPYDDQSIRTAREIRRLLGEQVPIVLVSIYDWSAAEARAAAAGVTGFLQKPLFRATLDGCIRQYVLKELKASDESGNASELSGKSILLAEDNVMNRQIMEELLSGMGARVETACDGQACVERFAQSAVGTFDLILMDVQMPRMNGYEAAEAIRRMERPDAAGVPIFALTADAFAEDIEEAKRAGMNSHLSKPLDLALMLREMKKFWN